MSHLRPVRSVGALLAVAAVAALTTAGIALAHGGHHHASHGGSYHAAKASAAGQPRPVAEAAGGACPVKSPPPLPAGSVSVTNNGQTIRVLPAGSSTAGPAETKQAPPLTGSVSVTNNGQTVRILPAGTPC